MPAWFQNAFCCVSALLAVVDAQRTVDLFLQFGHIVGDVDGNHRNTCTSAFSVFALALEVPAVDFMSSLRPAHIACEPRKISAQASSSDLGPAIAHLLIRS